MAIERSSDLRPFRTADGSFTLRSEVFNEAYHSVHGAVIESTHVFIKAGLDHVAEKGSTPIELLEVGLGTGLNMLLTWIRCLEGKCEVNYTALEPFPLAAATLSELSYWNDLAWPGLQEPFMELMSTVDRRVHTGGFSFLQRSLPVQQFNERSKYDLVYFDAFGPNTAPDMWTAEVLQRVFLAMRPGGVLVTYCAKGEVRRILASIGLQVERLKGPPGKREMIRATK